MRANANNYKLRAEELEAVRMLLNFEGTYGGGVKKVSAADIGNYFTYTIWLKNLYPQLKNAIFKGWFDQYFTLITDNDEMAKAYMVWQFLHFLNERDISPPPPDADPPEGFPTPFVSYWDIFIGNSWGWETPWYASDRHIMYYTTLDIPSNPPKWNTSVQTLFNTWKTNPPAAYISQGKNISDRGTLLTAESTILNNWAAFPALAAKGLPLWTSQSDMVKTMVAETVLAEEAYFFMLHLLIVACTGTVAEQEKVKKIIDTKTTSIEYSNDTFINQLIYSNLMYLADPLGDYGWTNPQLQSFITSLQSVIISSDTASAAIKASLQRSMKILVSSSAYPMNDPYCPSIGFSTRVADTLEALDAARKTMSI
ncbi:MAG TPA: hypothetical protein VFG10_16120 [Saprospiraceae bacterium]|nr:hypothetical protein [Saprospiraceae bacterium]